MQLLIWYVIYKIPTLEVVAYLQFILLLYLQNWKYSNEGILSIFLLNPSIATHTYMGPRK